MQSSLTIAGDSIYGTKDGNSVAEIVDPSPLYYAEDALRQAKLGSRAWGCGQGQH